MARLKRTSKKHLIGVSDEVYGKLEEAAYAQEIYVTQFTNKLLREALGMGDNGKITETRATGDAKPVLNEHGRTKEDQEAYDDPDQF